MGKTSFMRTKLTIAAGFIIAAAMVPCGLCGQGKAPEASHSSTVSASGSVTQDRNYTIGPEDVLDVDVWKQPDLSRKVPVRPDGKISLPLLGDIQAAGKTPTELGDSIEKELHKYVSDPQVTVIVTAINSQRIYVLGEVNRPGPEDLYPDMTVLQALAAAGGFTQFADRKKIYILSHDNAKEERHPFNYKAAIRGDQAKQSVVLRPGDTIIVP